MLDERKRARRMMRIRLVKETIAMKEHDPTQDTVSLAASKLPADAD
jgi:hypothetical protein